MELQGLLERTVDGLGYELVSVELSNRGRMLRIFIDKPAGPQGAVASGITVDDCARVVGTGPDDLILAAAKECPVEAISIVDSDTGEQVYP